MDPQAKLASWACITLISVTLGYIAACAFWPFGACRRCNGTGKHRSPSGRYFHDCRRCEGTGRRVRTGRRIWTTVRKYRDGAR